MRRFTLLLLAFSLTAAASPFPSDVKAAFAAAKREKKPLIIDFFGIWCPPCNELDEVVFSDPSFTAKAKSFVLLSVDADAQSSWKLKSEYKIGGYPTILFVAPNGKELTRFEGFRSLRATLQTMDEVLAAKGIPFEAACKKTDAANLWRCASVCSQRKDEACLSKALASLEKVVKPGSFLAGEARSLAVDAEKNPEARRLGYEQLLRDFPKHPRALWWAATYWESFSGEATQKPKRELIDAVLVNFDEIRRSPDRDAIGMTDSDALATRAFLLTSLGKDRDAIGAWNAAAESLAEAAKNLPSGSPGRGFALSRIGCLEEAGRQDEALKLAKEYLVKYPQEFTFAYRAASILWRKKKPEEALPLAEAAWKTSYGDNKLRVTTLLVKLLVSQNRKDEAKEKMNAVLLEVAPDAKDQVRSHRYIAELKKTATEVGL